MEVFSLSRGWKISMYILLSILMLVFVAMAFGPLFDPSMRKGVAFILPIALIIIGLLFCAFLQVEEKVIFDNYTIRKESRLVNRELLPGDIKGYKIDKNYLIIVPHKGRGKVIRVSTYMSRVGVLENKLAARYPDLNVQETQEVLKEVVEQTGDRDVPGLIKKAKIEVYTLTGITVALCALSYFYYGWFQILLFCCVPLALLLLLRHKGMVQLDTSKDSQLPSIALIPILVVAMQLLQSGSIHILHYSRIWPPALGIAVVLMGMLWTCSRYLNRKRGTYIIAAVVLAVAFVGNGYGIMISSNTILDKKGYEYYEATVTDKSISRGKTTTYYLTLQPWDHQPEVERESVDRDVFEAVEINGKAGIYYFQGAFNIPWYYVGSVQ
jgi:hypothetical protein